MGPCVLNTAKALKQSKTEPSAQDGMEKEVEETSSKKRVATNFVRFDEAVEDLRRKRENLTSLREKLQFFVEAAKRQNEKIVDEVENWLTGADNALDNAQMLENEIKENKRLFFNMSPDWWWRYLLSNEVAKRMLAVTGLASKFEQVRTLAKVSGQEFFLSEDFVLFDTHLSALKRIMVAFKDKRVSFIGLHGEGGVGKTALAKEVEKMAKMLKLFEKVVMVYLSLPPNIRSIQDEIAKKLNFKFQEHGEGRNDQLSRKLEKEKSILIIIDDFWRAGDSSDIGIPISGDFWRADDSSDVGIPISGEGRGNKLLLTTCRDEILLNDQSELMVRLDRLANAEAEDLFKTTASLNRTSSAFNEVATDIVQECNGLPIAIRVAAKALSGKTLEIWIKASDRFRGKSKTLKEWEDFCQNLGKPELIDESFKNVYYDSTQLQSRYDRFSRDAQLCFLLSYLFPEDYKIHVEDLWVVQFAWMSFLVLPISRL